MAVEIAHSSVKPHNHTGSNRAVLWCAVGAGFTTLFDNATVSFVAPAAAANLNASTSGLQWFLAAYSLTFGLGLVPGGRLGDAWGRRPFFLSGLAIFLIGGLATALAPNVSLLVAARLFQGLGAGLLSAQVMGLIQDHFTGTQRTKAFGLYTASGAAAALVGPIIAAALLNVSEDVGWRAVLLVPWIFGVITLALAVNRLDRQAVRRKVSLDIPGLCLLGILVVLALLPVLDIGLDSSAIAGVLLLIVVLCIFLVFWERHYAKSGRLPLFAPALIKSPRFIWGNITALLWFGSNLAVGSAIVIFLLAATDISPFLIAFMTVAGAAGRLFGAQLSSTAHSRVGIKVLVISLAIQAIAVCAMTAFSALRSEPAFIAVVAGLFLIHGLASGFAEPVVRSETLEGVDEHLRGVAASFLQLTQRLSASFLAAVTAGVIFAGNSTPDSGNLRTALIICLAVTTASFISSIILARYVRVNYIAATPAVKNQLLIDASTSKI